MEPKGCVRKTRKPSYIKSAGQFCKDFIGLSARYEHGNLHPTIKNCGADAMRRLTIGALLLGFLPGPVYAQQPSMAGKDPMVLDQELRKKDAEVIDRQYKSTLEKTNRGTTPVGPADPWSNMRGADDSKTKR
jgi:hypothetical protein